MTERVVITGWGFLSPLGCKEAEVLTALRQGRSGVRLIEEWEAMPGLQTRVGAPVAGSDLDASTIPRTHRRTMGRLSLLSTLATEAAIASAQLDEEQVCDPQTGLALGSTTGSPAAIQEMIRTLDQGGVKRLKGTLFMKVMSHTCAANTAVALGIRGRVFSPSAACASASQAIGFGYEMIRAGSQRLMFCGGAEELHVTTAATFDTVRGASRAWNDSPQETPRPFDRSRDGMVVGEGAGVLVLESLTSARERGVPLYGEILGFHSTCDGQHISVPAPEGMQACMAGALQNAAQQPQQIEYLNAHATGTETGDRAEAEAIARLFQKQVPTSSLKGHMGHTLGACGALEIIFTLLALADSFLPPTLNLQDIDPDCAGIQHIQHPQPTQARLFLSNSFAFGGINTSLLLRQGPPD